MRYPAVWTFEGDNTFLIFSHLFFPRLELSKSRPKGPTLNSAGYADEEDVKVCFFFIDKEPRGFPTLRLPLGVEGS